MGRPFTSPVLVLLCFGLTPNSVEAQDPPVAFRQLTIADGLSQNAVHAILQGRRGFMWFGTKDGLNRYDGHGFVVFRHDPFDSTSLSDNHVTALFEDGRGTLWVGTRSGGLNRFDRARETFHRYPDGPTHPITAIRQGHEGDLWIGTDGSGLYRVAAGELDAPRPRFARFVHDARDPRSLSDDRVHAVLVDRRGEVWIGTDAGMDRLRPAAPDPPGFTRYVADPTDPVGLIDRHISALHEDGAGRLWIGSIPGLSVFDPDRRRITHYYHRYRTYRYGWGQAIDLLEGRAGQLWMSTHSELMRFDPVAATFTYFRHDPRDPRSIISNAPTALFQDRSGVLWIGTNGFGINMHDPKAGRFQTFRRPENRSSRQAGFSVYTLFEDGAGRIWIDAGLLYRWDRKTGTFVSFETSSDRPDDFGNTGVWSLVEHPSGFLWAATYQGLYHYEIATGRFRQYKHEPNDPNGLPEQTAYDVLRARDGTLWVVTENYLAKLVDAARGRFRSYRSTERRSAGEWTFPALHEDADGVLWFGSNQGLVRFDPRTEAMRHYRHDPRRPGSLSHDAIRAIHPDPRVPARYLWIGTAGGGLNRFDRVRETFVHYTVADGLPNNVVYGILPDDAGHLWLSTNRGLSRFDPRTAMFRNYDAEDGLQSNEFNSGAAFRSPSGELFFGGIYGFNFFRPEAITDNPHVPPVVLTAFRRANQYEAVGDSGSVLAAAITETASLRLSYRDNVITFEFAALDYSAPAKNRYAYRMLGFNDEWIEAGSVRAATYTNLPPGAYTFQVRGANNDGVWNEDGVSLAIVVTPPWWRTWWAYTLAGLLMLATMYGLRRYEMNRLRLKTRLDMERFESDQLRELDRARSRFFANVSHEFRTPLTLTLGPLDDLRAGLHGPLAPAAMEQVELARRNAGRVLGLINQILEVARLESGRTPLRARRIDLRDLVRNVARAFVPLAERKAITFDVQVPPDPLTLYADPEQIDKVLSNLLSNALKFTPEGGGVRVTLDTDAERVRIAVRDTGPGIPAADLTHVFERFYRVHTPSRPVQPGTGIGLALAKELVDLHRGALTVESEEGFGSTFTVTLRQGRAHLTPDQLVEDAGEPWTASPSVAAVEAVEHVEETGGAPVDGGAAEDDVTRVLVIEDNAEVRTYIRKHLAPTYRVLEAADGQQGLEMARRLLPDLVLSDVMMPGLDGHTLCRALKADPETDFIPIVLLTARAGAEDRLAGLREQADDYLTKPFDVPELLARIENLIAVRKRLRERFGGARLDLHAGMVDVTPADEQFLDRVRVAIEDHLADETFTVEQLARTVAHSRGHLHRRLRALLDESPSDLIRRLRLERAAQLLDQRAGSVAEVAYAVGFKSVAHFSNRFQEQFGVRPSSYRADRARVQVGGGPAVG